MFPPLRGTQQVNSPWSVISRQVSPREMICKVTAGIIGFTYKPIWRRPSACTTSDKGFVSYKLKLGRTTRIRAFRLSDGPGPHFSTEQIRNYCPN